MAGLGGPRDGEASPRPAGRRGETKAVAGIPPSEQIRLVVRRHGAVLVVPVLRTSLGLLAMVTGLALLPLLLFAVIIAVEVRHLLHVRVRTCLLTAGGAVLMLLLLGGPASSVRAHLLVVIALLAWLGFDVLEWQNEVLVVTTKRLYRSSGIVVRHVPSVALTGIAFIDAAVSPFGRALDYGTILLDSAAQRDQPLARFDFVPQVLDVHARILELRAAAMPTWPRPPG